MEIGEGEGEKSRVLSIILDCPFIDGYKKRERESLYILPQRATGTLAATVLLIKDGVGVV